jgi:predicted peptidase
MCCFFYIYRYHTPIYLYNLWQVSNRDPKKTSGEMKMKKYLVLASLVVSVIVLFAVMASSQLKDKTVEAQKVKTGVMTPQKIQKSLAIPVKGQYLLFLPETYGESNKRFPLILFLHGSGECGTNLDLVKQFGIPRVAPLRKNFPFIVLAPQCPKGAWWTDTRMIIRVMAMLDEVCNKYMVDRSRIYLTGMSMGGFGTWALLEQFPNRFAAAAPVCGGGGNRHLAYRMRSVPIRIYHGGLDKSVSSINSRSMDSALKKIRANVQLIIYPKMGHDIWDKVYTSDDFYDWLLKQKR